MNGQDEPVLKYYLLMKEQIREQLCLMEYQLQNPEKQTFCCVTRGALHNKKNLMKNFEKLIEYEKGVADSS
jgi:hypothetical protein